VQLVDDVGVHFGQAENAPQATDADGVRTWEIDFPLVREGWVVYGHDVDTF
jgi:hypothetical protein